MKGSLYGQKTIDILILNLDTYNVIYMYIYILYKL